LIVATVLQVLIQWVRTKKVSKMLLVSAGLVAVFGGITLALRNPLFLQWKVTIVNWLFAATFLCCAFFGKKTLIERAMAHAIELPRTMWQQLDLMWAATFALIGGLNLYVMYHFSIGVWANFKVWGTLGITLLALAGQVLWISKRAPPQSTDQSPGKPSG
jgi:intracellular septation protein